MDFFSPYRQSHPLNPLIEGPPPMYWPNTSRWCLAPCACTTTIYVCLLLLPRHSYHSYVILLCSAYKVVFISFGVRGVRAFGLTLPSFVPPWTRYSLSKGIYLYSPLDFHFCHFSCPSHRPYGCQSFPIGPLGLLPFSLGFLAPSVLSLPLIPPTNLLAVIPAMLAPWACYLFPWASSAYLFYLYLLFLPRACWLSFSPCQPIKLSTYFLKLSQLIYFIFTSYPTGLLAIIPVIMVHWVCYIFHWASSAHYFIFTSYSSHEPVGCHSYQIGPLGLITCFYHSYIISLPFLLLLSFFCYKASIKSGHQQI